MIHPSRRFVLAGALAVAGCGGPPDQRRPGTLAEAIDGAWRTPGDRARDRWRHPAQSLAFWGLEPGNTVVEFWPGAGWYTEILAPFLAGTRGKLYAAHLQLGDPPDPAARDVVEAYRGRFAEGGRLYGDVEMTAFGATSGPVAPAGTADLALFLRNLHNWMAAGIAEKAFRDAYLALKPGGILGVEEHRAAPGGVPDVLAESGYVDQSYAIRLGQEAGFRLAATSEINANPRDTRDHPFGVWTLPPVRRSSPRGKQADPAFDRAAYDAIGESDRMTLKFVKPA
ncbi:MAG: methyltransferase [Phenylobacterium sp.]|nr:methyltransferase [Phenylobacterium sp.]